MPDTLIYIILFIAIMLFMHRGHGTGGCGGHSHIHHKGHNHSDDKSHFNPKSGTEHKLHH